MLQKGNLLLGNAMIQVVNSMLAKYCDLCPLLGLYEGDKCKLPKHMSKGEKHKNLMQFLKGVKARNIVGKFEPVRRPCKHTAKCNVHDCYNY